MLPPNNNKMKFRSIGLKKKEMVQFTELNRYKNILKLLSTVKNQVFLAKYAKILASAISRVSKSKFKEMQNTKGFLNSLLAAIDTTRYELR